MKKNHIWYSLSLTVSVLVFSYVFRQNYASANDQQIETHEKLNAYCNQVENNPSIAPEIKERVLKSLSWKIQVIEEAKERKIDLSSDDSYERYLSDSRLLKDTKYEPTDLEKIADEYAVVKAYRPYLRKEAAQSFALLSKAFYEKFNKKLYIVSAYRSYNDQLHLINDWCEFERCAKVGWSEHQLWLAVDIHIANAKWWYRAMWWEFFDRLKENAYLYGFHNTYSKGYNVDGKMVESRHWRYLGKDFAKILYDRWITISEYTKS